MAASQKSSPVENWKPMRGSSITTTLQTIQTAKDKNSGGMEKIRLRTAMVRPDVFQNSSSSGRQLLNQRPAVASGLASSSSIN